MRHATLFTVAAALALTFGCGGKKDDSKAAGKGAAKGTEASEGGTLATEDREITFGSTKVKGKFPTGWVAGTMGDYQLKGTAEGMDDMVLAAIDFDAFGGTQIDEAKMKAEMEKRKNDLLTLEIAGKKGELVEDLAEVSPGVFSMVVKTPEFADDSKWEFNVTTFHLPAQGGDTMFMCKARSRLTKQDLWKALKPVCAGLTFTP